MSTNNELLKRAIDAVTVRQVIEKFGRAADVPSRDGVKFCSILRGDQHPSCSIEDNKYHDWTRGEHRDSYDLYQQLSGLDSRTAFVPFIQLSPFAHELSLNGNGNHTHRGNTPGSKFNWSELVKNVTDQDIEALSDWRGYSIEFCRWLVDGQHIGRKGEHWAFPVFGEGSVVAAHIRHDKRAWQYDPKLSQLGLRTTPLVLGDLRTAKLVIIGESQWDVFATIDVLGIYRAEPVAGIATRGSANAELISILATQINGISVLIVQNDLSGQAWLDKAKMSLRTGFKVVRAPDGYRDANDWCLDCGDIAGAIKDAPLEQPATKPGQSGSASKLDSELQRDFPTEAPRKLVGASFLEFSRRPIDESKTLLGDRYLCRGGGWLVVAPSGHGKSTFAAQASIQLACGLPAFGIKPPRPIRSFVIQSEDDDGDITEMAQIIDHLELSPDQRKMVADNTHIEFVNDVTANGFFRVCDSFLERWPCDLLWINPYTAYLGADIKDDEANCLFLRNGLNPLLTKHNCAAVPVHHTPKLNFRNAENWKPSDWMYAGAGAAVLTNWARAILVIDPCEEAGTYRFIAAKRGKRIGWGNGHSGLYVTYWSHCREEAKLLWIPATEAEIKASAKSKWKAEDLLDFISPVDPKRWEQIYEEANQKREIGRDKLKSFLKELTESGKTSVITVPRKNARPEEKYIKNAVLTGQ